MLNQVFISYRHESQEHKRSVHRLGKLLRDAKIPVELDEFFLAQNPGGPDDGWPRWCEKSANESQCVLVIASKGWFEAYDKKGDPGSGFGSAAEADLLRQSLWDEKGNNTRIRLVFVDKVAKEIVPPRLRAWHQFHPLDSDEDLNQLFRWLAESLKLTDVELPTVSWPTPIPFQPDLADRSKKEWPAIVSLLAGHSRERILLFEGDSGFGKSEILRQAADYAKKLQLRVAPINLKCASSVEGILGDIDLELGALLPNFSREGANKAHLLRKDFRKLREPVLLIFDHYEDVAANKAIADWLNQQLLTEVETSLSLVVVVAGQKVPDNRQSGWRDVALHILLEPITEVEAWEEWVTRRYPEFQNKDHLRSILKVAEGKPAVMANFCATLAKS